MRTKQTLPAPLKSAGARFDHWRANRTGRRIPESLWNLAVNLAGEYGNHRTARALRLNVDSLKARVIPSAKKTGRVKSRSADPRPEFVEILSPTYTGGAEYVVELEDANGAKMTIRAKGASLDLASLTTSFRRGEA